MRTLMMKPCHGRLPRINLISVFDTVRFGKMKIRSTFETDTPFCDVSRDLFSAVKTRNQVSVYGTSLFGSVLS